MIGLVVVVLAAAGGTAFLLTRSDEPFVQAAGEVFLEPAAEPGPEPFTTEIDTGTPPRIDVKATPAVARISTTTSSTTSTSTGETTSSTLPAATIGGAIGSDPGLYGGTKDASRCDPGQLVAFLQANPDKASAWVTGITNDPSFRWSGGTSLTTADIPAFVAELTPVTLTVDTRVTNNGFRNGRPTPRQAVLQAGTSVLVDTFGVPRAKCNCGNPLGPPVAQTTSVSYTGNSWTGFDPATTVAVQPATEAMTSISVIDLADGELIDRPVGTTGEADAPTGVFIAGPLTTDPVITAGSSTTTGTPSSTTQGTTTPTTGEGTTTTEPLSVLTTTDYCTAYAEYSQIDSDFYLQYDDPAAVPEYRDFLGRALHDMATLAPAEVKADWILFRDFFDQDPDGYLSIDQLGSPEFEGASERIFTHLMTTCGEDLFNQ